MSLTIGSLAAALALAPVQAAGDAHLAVVGKLQGGACSVRFAQGSTLDLGLISLAQVNPGRTPTLLPKVKLGFSIDCPEPVAVGLTLDTSVPFFAAGEVAPALEVDVSQLFNLEIDGQVVGAYTAWLDADEQVGDGTAVTSLIRTGGGWWRELNRFDTFINHTGQRISHAWGADLVPGRYRTLTSSFTLHPALSGRDYLPALSDALEVRGDMKFRLTYL